MKNIKKIIATAICMCTLFALCSCASSKNNTKAPTGSGTSNESYTANVMALKGPTGMSVSYLMDGNGEGNYNISLASSPDEVVSAFVSGNVDIAAVPINLAATLYNKLEGDVTMIEINTLGVLYILENGEKIKDITDLNGKTIYATGEASTPEYILNYILEQNNIKPKKIEYYADHSELSTVMASEGSKVKIAMLPEPNVTATIAKNSDIRVALNLTEEWDKVCDTSLVQGCVIAKTSFIEEHQDVVGTFIKDCEKSVAYMAENPNEAAKSIADNGILASEAIAKKAMPNCNIVCMTGNDMAQTASNMLDILFKFDKKSVGGKLPGDDFYYIYK